MKIFLKIRNYKFCITIEFIFSEGIDLAKSSGSRECIKFYYLLFNHGFQFQDSLCNDCHVFTMLIVNISDIVIITVKNVDYSCIVGNISIFEAITVFRTFCA